MGNDLPVASVEPRGVRLASDGALIDLPATEVVEAASARDRPVMILARVGADAEEFRREHGLSSRRTIYATPESVRGWTDYEIVVLPGFHARRDAERTWATMLPGLRAGRPAPPAYPRWAGTEPQEGPDPDLDSLTRAQLAELDGPASVVAEILDEWNRREHGVVSSNHGVGLFLELLAARGYRVTLIEAPAFADVLPASSD